MSDNRIRHPLGLASQPIEVHVRWLGKADKKGRPAMSDNRIHHPFGASSMARRRLCPGSYKQELGLVVPDSEDAQEGTMLHEAVSRKDIPSGLTSEQETAVMFCRDWIDEQDYRSATHELRVEIQLAGQTIHSWFDFVAFREDNTAILVDWKFGRGDVDPAYENTQLAMGALGLWQQYGVEAVDTYIVQPRTCFVSHHRFTEFCAMQEVLAGIILKCLSDNAPLIRGEAQCKYCKANILGTCPLVAKDITALERVNNTAPLQAINGNALAELYVKLNMLDKMRDAVKSEMRERLERGEDVPGYFLKPRKGNAKCSDPVALYGAIQDTLTVQEYMSCCDVSLSRVIDKYARTKKNKVSGTIKEHAEFCKALADAFVVRGEDTTSIEKKKEDGNE